jgi:hypothetical protein
MTPLVITIYDFVLIAAFSAAAVVSLGGRTTFVFGGVTLAMDSPVTLAVIAAGLLCLRLLHWARLPPLPSLSPATPLLDEQRRRMATAVPVTRRVAWYALAAGAGSLVWVLPHLLRLHEVPDLGDPVFSAWRIAALTHQLTTDPLHLWNGNIFYPATFTLTYSDSLFLQSILGAPFLLAGADPLVVMNALMVVSFPARGLAFFFAAWRLTDDPQAALVAALAGAWAPFHADHYSQLELQWTAFVPLALLGVLRLLAAPRWRTGLAFGAAVAAQCLACMYVGVMLVTFLVPFTAVVAVAWRVRPSRRLAEACAGTALVLLPIAGGLAAAYLQGREAHGDRRIQDVAAGSASAREYADATGRLVTYQWQARLSHHGERELFPGATPVVLGAVGLSPPLQPVVIAAVVGGAAAFDWSLGLKGLTYEKLYNLSPAYRGMRVAARFSVMVEAVLALLAGFGAARILRLRFSSGAAKSTGPPVVARGLVCAALCAVVLVDLRMDLPLQPYPRSTPRIYRYVNPSMVLEELPSGRTLDYMYFSTRHWAKLLTGYSGFGTDLSTLEAAEASFPAPEAIAAFRRLGATHLTYNCAFDKANGKTDADCDRVFEALRANPSLSVMASEWWKGSLIRLYRYSNSALPSSSGREPSRSDPVGAR